MSADRQRKHLPGAALDRERLWGKSRAQQETVARVGLKDILQAVCREMQPHTLQALVAQAKFHLACNFSRKDGLFVYFAGWVRAAWDELPTSMTWRWMHVHDVEMDGGVYSLGHGSRGQLQSGSELGRRTERVVPKSPGQTKATQAEILGGWQKR